MELALECPTALLGEIQPLADFDWILTHLVLQDEEYATFYKESKRFRVLDNSVNELLEPCSIGDMLEADRILGGADLVVPPDYLGNAYATRKALEDGIEAFGLERVLPVVQGSTLDEVWSCAEYISWRLWKLDRGRIAIPYDLTCKRTDSLDTMAKVRVEVVRVLSEEFSSIHLLGMTLVEEFESYEGNSSVTSLDTGVPILLAQKGQRLDGDGLQDKKDPTLSRMDSSKDWQTTASAYWNIAYLRRLVNGAG